MNTASASLVLPAAMLALSGCAMTEAEDVGTDESAVISANGISANGISANGISANGISANGISANGISANGLTTYALSPTLLTAVQDPSTTGDNARMFVHYLIDCALTPSQSFSFNWTDAQGANHAETYTGNLSLAPDWATGPLDLEGQHLVSACIAARTNYFGIHVDISLRADVDVLADNTTKAELGAYSFIEGAFWGNLFSSTPYLSACYKADNVAHSRASLRECAAGYVDASGNVQQCGPIHILGSCANVCKRLLNPKTMGYYTGCAAKSSVDPDLDDAIVTVGLQ
jgi:hypothetical protein